MDLKTKWNVLPRRDRTVFELYLVLVVAAAVYGLWSIGSEWPVAAVYLGALVAMSALVVGALIQKARKLQSAARRGLSA